MLRNWSSGDVVKGKRKGHRRAGSNADSIPNIDLAYPLYIGRDARATAGQLYLVIWSTGNTCLYFLIVEDSRSPLSNYWYEHSDRVDPPSGAWPRLELPDEGLGWRGINQPCSGHIQIMTLNGPAVEARTGSSALDIFLGCPILFFFNSES